MLGLLLCQAQKLFKRDFRVIIEFKIKCDHHLFYKHTFQ